MRYVRWVLFACATFFCAYTNADVPPLTVEGNQILSGGEAKSFAGNSFFWSNTGWGGERFYNADAVEWLKEDWNSTLVRASLGVEADGSYFEDRLGNLDRITRLVDGAIANDVYVIIDWHSHHAEGQQAEAISFFQDMARRYGDNNHVIYEIYNEPLQVSWSNTIKPYAEAVIAAIREIDPDNLIVVGTPTWSQDVDVASRDPIRGYDNIAYTLHFYAGTHGQWLRNKAQTALNNGIAIMVTEWGSVNANGDGAVARGEAQAWMDFLKQNNISHANWAVNDKVEGASILNPGAPADGGWTQADLTASGQFVKDIISNWGTEIGGNGSSSSSLSSSSSNVSSSRSSDSTSGTGEYCNWYGTAYPLCVSTQSGWGWESNRSCIARSTCENQPAPWGIEGGDGSSSSSHSSSLASPSSSSSSSSSSSVASSSSDSSSSDRSDCPTINGGQSGNFGTTGAYCFKTQDAISGWGASNLSGRSIAVTVNGSGTAVTEPGAPLPNKAPSDYYYFNATGGGVPWASVYWW